MSHETRFELFDRFRCLYLLLSLVALMALYPYLGRDGVEARLFNGLFTAVMLFGLYAVSRSPVQFYVSGALLLPALVGSWTATAGENELLEVVLAACLVTFFGVLSVLVLRYVFTACNYVADRLCGALSVYLLMGIAFSEIYRMLYVFDPGHFAVSEGGRALSAVSTRFVYFSFVTQTTMGYGDVTPATAATESLTILQATAGVIYLAVLVAWLVGSIRPLESPSDGPG